MPEKEKTPTMTVKFLLSTDLHEKKVLDSVFYAAKCFLNASLNKIDKIISFYRYTSEFKKACKIYKEINKLRKIKNPSDDTKSKIETLDMKRKELYVLAKNKTQKEFEEYFIVKNSKSLFSNFGIGSNLRYQPFRQSWIKDKLLAMICVDLLNRVENQAANKLYKKTKLHFYGNKKSLYSLNVPQKENACVRIKQDVDKYFATFTSDKNNKLEIPIVLDREKFDNEKQRYTIDVKQQFVLDNLELVKHCRLLREKIKGEWQYFIVVSMETDTLPSKKPRKYGEGLIAIDIAPLDIAWFNFHVSGKIFLKDFEEYHKILEILDEIKKLQQKADRKNILNNPDCYEIRQVQKGKYIYDKYDRIDGTKCITSKGEQILRDKIADLYRAKSAIREQMIYAIANELRIFGNIIITEKNPIAAWCKSKRSSRQIQNFGIGSIMPILNKRFDEVKTFHIRAACSQHCPNCSVYTKCVGDIHVCNGCKEEMERDLLASYNSYFVGDDGKINEAEARKYWGEKKHLLLDVWKQSNMLEESF